MDNTRKKLLMDILTCIETIETYIGNNKIFSEYDSNFLVQDAVERNGYDEIENVQVWSILINHLPILKNEAKNLLGETKIN